MAIKHSKLLVFQQINKKKKGAPKHSLIQQDNFFY